MNRCRSLGACALSRLARGSRGDHRTFETTGEPSTLLWKNDRRQRGQRDYLRYERNLVGETLREVKESEQVNGRCRGR